MEGLLFSPEMLGILLMVGVIAGFIDSIAGGGGLLTVPALLATGISPAEALATNKLQSIGGSFSSSLYFIRRKVVDWRSQKLNVALTLLGSMIGAILIQQLQAELLRRMLPLLVIAIGLYFLLIPKVGEEDRRQRLTALPFGLLVGGGIGFYDGFFGPGAGSFYALGFVTLMGFNLTKATAHAKLLNFTSNLGSLIFFTLGGHVIWGLGAVMLLGQVIGARLGAHMVLTRGRHLIRPMIVLMSLAISSKLLYESYWPVMQLWLVR